MRQTRARLVVGVLAASALTLAACGGDTPTAGGSPTAAVTDPGTEATTDAGTEAATDDGTEAGAEVTLRFSCSCVPADHHTEAIYTFEREVEERTGGSVQVEVFDSASLFDQTGEQTALLQGDVEMAYASPQWVTERVPEASITGTPYLIDDVEHLYAVMDGEVGQAIFDAAVEKAGIRPITTIYLGTRQLNLRDIGREVMTPEDLAGVKLRVPDAASWIRMGEALGADPTPLAFGELYLALQTGTVDGQDNPLPTTRNAKFYEVTSQVVLTGHLVNDVWPTINEEVWQTLSPEQQTAVEESWAVAREEATAEALTRESEAASFFEGEGLTVYEPDRDAFRTHVLEQYTSDEALTSTWIEGHLEAIEELR